MEGFLYRRLNANFHRFVHAFVFEKEILDVLGQNFFNEFRHIMTVHSVAITNPEQVSVFLCVILYHKIGVLICFFLLLRAKTTPIAYGILCYNIVFLIVGIFA